MWMVSSAFPVSCGRDELGRNHNPRQSLSNGANQKPSSAFIFIKLLSTLFWYVLKLELRMVDLFLGLSQVALVVKNPPANAGDIRDLGSISGSGRSPGGEHGNPLQYSCLENPRGQRSLEGYSPGGHKESETTERLSPHTCTTNFQQPFRLIRFAPRRGGVGWSCVSGGSGVEGDAEVGVQGVWCHQTEHRESVCCRR